MMDLIDRQTLMKEFSDFVRESNNSDFAQTPTWNDAVSLVGSTPSAQQWIPCSERLPNIRESVILTTKGWTGEGCYWATTDYHVIWKGYRWSATYWDDEVIAWMPLPEPWKGDSE